MLLWSFTPCECSELGPSGLCKEVRTRWEAQLQRTRRRRAGDTVDADVINRVANLVPCSGGNRITDGASVSDCSISPLTDYYRLGWSFIKDNKMFLRTPFIVWNLKYTIVGTISFFLPTLKEKKMFFHVFSYIQTLRSSMRAVVHAHSRSPSIHLSDSNQGSLGSSIFLSDLVGFTCIRVLQSYLIALSKLNDRTSPAGGPASWQRRAKPSRDYLPSCDQCRKRKAF